MPNDFTSLTVLSSSVSYTTRGGVTICLPNLPICVPTTLVPLRGRFNCIPEILNTIINKGIKPSMLKCIDIKIDGKLQK